MKKIKLFLAAVTVPALFAAVLMLTGCEKEMPEKGLSATAVQSNLDRLPGKYKRTVELHDGASRVTLGIAADDPAKLDDFEMTAAIEGFTSLPVADAAIKDLSLGKAGVALSDSGSVHICLIDEKRGPGIVGFQLQVKEKPTGISGKVEESGTYHSTKTFYSWEAPHHFYVRPNGNTTVSGSFYRVPNTGPTWSLLSSFSLYHYTVTLDNGSNAYDYRLTANGSDYYVYWY